MATTFISRGPTHFDSPIDSQLRHIPIKRIAPCPPSDYIVAQPKRSRLVHPPDSMQPMKRPSLSVRNVNIQNDTRARAISWGQANCFQSYASVGNPVTPCADVTAVKCLRYDSINSSNVSRVSRAATVSDMKKSRCCPVLTSSSGFSTPPYSVNNATAQKDAKKSSRRRPLSQRLKRRSADGKKLKSTGCLSVLKNAAHCTIKTAEACIEKNVPQPELNALSVYHSFLKQREDATRVEKLSQNHPSTVLTRVSSTTSRASNSSVRYSSNFNPQLTSTPQKAKDTETDFDGEFKKPHAPPPSRKPDSAENPLTEVLRTLEEERKAGSSHISLPLRELTEMVMDLQKQQNEESMHDTASCASSTGTTATNNNNEDLSVKLKPKIAKSRLPGMYPIGAPRAASSPISSCRKREFAIFDESCEAESGDKVQMRKRHMAGDFNNSSVFSTGVAGGATDVWRPW